MFAHLTASISIHALVKRATKLENVYNNKPIYFNPRPREEGDEQIFRSLFYSIDFNPRPREEGDLFRRLERNK